MPPGRMIAAGGAHLALVGACGSDDCTETRAHKVLNLHACRDDHPATILRGNLEKRFRVMTRPLRGIVKTSSHK
jgi:hypothetical protein